jgi:glutathione S-transferase
MKLYSGPLSLFTAKVRVALAEKGLGYEKVSVPWSLAARYEPKHPDVVALNPKAQVPVLVDGELAIYDSTQIFEYLEDRYPEPPLYPRDPAGRARCRRLEAAADEQIFPFVWELIDGAFYPPGPGGRDTSRVTRAQAGLAREYERLDKELTGRDMLCGAFGVADITTFIMVHTATALGAPPAEAHGALRSWQARVGARPAVKRDVEEMQRVVAEQLRAAS